LTAAAADRMIRLATIVEQQIYNYREQQHQNKTKGSKVSSKTG
jgi:hypothetical protein